MVSVILGFFVDFVDFGDFGEFGDFGDFGDFGEFLTLDEKVSKGV